MKGLCVGALSEGGLVRAGVRGPQSQVYWGVRQPCPEDRGL